MQRTQTLFSATLLIAAVAAPAWAQQLQRPAPASQPARQTTPATTPSTLPATPAERVRPTGAIPQTGPSTPARPAPPVVQPMQPAPPAPMPVRDAQGRIVPGAQPMTGDRARDPVTGQEFRTTPNPARPR